MSGDTRKSELAELKSQLGLLAGSRAPGAAEARRELFKKVISLMTIGVDVSSVFSEMVICSAGNDLVLKKMCYLYVCNYAVMKPELALLTINFLQRDCQDDDPMIRGLALRSLCSLRVKNLVEYLLGPIERGLQDSSSYVRSMAVMGVLKLYHLAPAACREHEFIGTLKGKIVDDPDAQVVANCVCALQEILNMEAVEGEAGAEDRDALVSKTVLFSLLNRIRDLSEWAQCIILELAAKFVPETADDTFDVMNLLEDRLQHANSAVVLATCKVFLHLTLSMPDTHTQVYERIKTPLLTLVGTSPPEESYAVLSHLSVLVVRAPGLFAGDYKQFFVRVSDPPYVKKLKLSMLTAIANDSNKYDIVTELTEYAADMDVSFAREAIRAVGQIALQCYDVNGIVDRLLQFLEMETDYVTAETLVLVKDLLRKYPQWSQDCIAVVGGVSSRTVVEPRAKAALVWMLGEYGEHMGDAPYMMEGFADTWDEEQTSEVRLEMLTAAAKLFFKRPPECQKLLGTVLSRGLQDTNQDVHDRALLYYRLLKAGVDVARRVINPAKQAVSVFADGQSSEVRDRIFDEFNTLSVVYGKPAYLFLDKEQRTLLEAEAPTPPAAALPAPMGPASASSPYSEKDSLLSSPAPAPGLSTAAAPSGRPNGVTAGVPAAPAATFDLLSDPLPPPSSSAAAAPASLLEGSASSGTATSAPSPTGQSAAAVADIAGAAAPAVVRSTSSIDELLELGASSARGSSALGSSGSGGTAAGAAGLLEGLDARGALVPAPVAPPVVALNPRAVLDAPTFQRKWGQLPVADTLKETLPPQFTVALTSAQQLLRHMAAKHIQCMASGGQAPKFKFFFYAQRAGHSGTMGMFLVELQVDTGAGTATAKVKADETDHVATFTRQFCEALTSFGLL